jgi:hypothetical protein
MPQLTGPPLSDELPLGDTLELAHLLHTAGYEDVADVLDTAIEERQPVVALNAHDREAITTVIGDAPDEFAELRAVLLREAARHARLREGTPGTGDQG